jgi:predicted porin
MQKKIIALAIAGLVSGVAYAQSNVTIYGVLDVGYNYARSSGNSVTDGQKFSGMQDGGDVGRQGSRLGFRGEEALGNGLKAVFTVEFGLNPKEGENLGARNNRQSFVGLAGGFGTVTVGRQYAPSGGGYLGPTSANGISGANISNFYVGNFITLQTGNGSRWNNSVAYDSPNWSGFQLRGVYSFGNNVRDSFSDATTDASRLGLGVRYTNGPLYLTAIYQTQFDNDAIRNAAGNEVDDGNKAWAFGGSYDFKVVKVFANYIREKDKGFDTTPNWTFPNAATGLVNTPIYADRDDIKKTYWSLGLSVPVTAVGSVEVEYARYKSDQTREMRSHGLSATYVHTLSKRTKLYTTLTRLSNQDNIGTDVIRANARVGINGESQTSFAVGINHNF